MAPQTAGCGAAGVRETILDTHTAGPWHGQPSPTWDPFHSSALQITCLLLQVSAQRNRTLEAG